MQVTGENTHPRPGERLPGAFPAGVALQRVLGMPSFRLLWAGQGISLLGDQFYLIALPWLVLQLTGDPLALGTVFAAIGIPRALFMLVGGAFTDRITPRRVMIFADLGRAGLAAALAVLVGTQTLPLEGLYLFAGAFGVAAGLFLPASSAIVPAILDDRDLPAGNMLVQGTAQLAAVVGPLLAGTVIGLGGRATPGGLALAIAVDAATFVVSLCTLWRMPTAGGVPSPGLAAHAAARNRPSLATITAIREGLAYAGRDPLLRTVLATAAVLNLVSAGPLAVGIPILVARTVPEGVAALGLLMAIGSAGILTGAVLAGALPPPAHLARRVPGVLTLLAGAFAGLGLGAGLPAISLALFGVGLAVGYLTLLLTTWVQQHTPHRLMGRMMSVLLFVNLAGNPISQVVASGVVRWGLVGLFLGAGSLVLGVAVLLTQSRALREVRR